MSELLRWAGNDRYEVRIIVHRQFAGEAGPGFFGFVRRQIALSPSVGEESAVGLGGIIQAVVHNAEPVEGTLRIHREKVREAEVAELAADLFLQ